MLFHKPVKPYSDPIILAQCHLTTFHQSSTGRESNGMKFLDNHLVPYFARMHFQGVSYEITRLFVEIFVDGELAGHFG
jgi:hypothetical protein